MNGNTPYRTVITENDIILAWNIRMILQAMAPQGGDPMTPTRDELGEWLESWTAIKHGLYSELVASYTDDQRAIIARMTEADRNAKLCRRRLMNPEGVHGDRAAMVAWPTKPPE